MPEEIRLWRVGEGDCLQEVEGSRLDLEARLERWLEEDISILSPDLIVIGRQVETDHGGVIDLLCMDPDGDLVIVELKRDKTPREITAQVLDYASWIRDLSHSQVTELANAYLRDHGPLEKRFKDAFDVDLPDTLNDGHGMIVVGSRIDSRTERIIQYLLDEYGVNINAATFCYFQARELGELLGRVFLIDPERVADRVGKPPMSKRQPNLTYEEMEAAAEGAGVGNLYRAAFDGLARSFVTKTTRSTAGFKARFGRSRRVLFNLLPSESSPEQGLCFQAYTVRLAEHLQVDEATVEAALPQNHQPWVYGGASDKDNPGWRGHSGYFRTAEEIETFLMFVDSHLGQV